MNTTEQREAVITEAISWLGTGYHHLGNLKGVGVDCAMILVEVFSKAGVIEWFDPRPYPTDWFLHQSEEKYLQTMLPYAKEIPLNQAKRGDVILMKLGRTFSHSAILLDSTQVIHAYAGERCVTYGDLTQLPFRGRAIKAFNPYGDVTEVIPLSPRNRSI